MTDVNLVGSALAVNEALRHEFARLPITVKAVADGNADRAGVVSGHVAFMCDWLEAYETGREDGSLVSECAGVRSLASAWAAQPGSQERAALHTALIALERQVLHRLAIADQRDRESADPALVQSEAQAAMDSVVGAPDGEVRAIRIGLVAADASPANRLAFIAAMPSEQRAQFDAQGIAVYESYRSRLTDY